MREYHHIGIPTQTKRENERYVEKFKVFIWRDETRPYGVEWLRFEDDSPFPELIKTVPHVAFVVDDLENEIKDKDVIVEPSSPSEGTRIAFIVDDGVPIEFLELT